MKKRKRWIKRIGAALFAAVLVCTLVNIASPLTAKAYSWNAATGTLTLSSDDDFENNSAFTNLPIKKLVITGNVSHLEMYNVFRYIESLEISSNGLKEMPTLFQSTNLQSVTITSATVKTIPSKAFEDCRLLNSITLPDGLTTIGANAFVRCTSLTSIEIPTSVTSIGTDAFAGCSNLQTFYYPAGLDISNIGLPESTQKIPVSVPSIMQHPSDVAVEEGGTASFTVAAGGTEPLSYRWQVNNGTGWADIQGANQSTYTVTAVQKDWNGWQYRCVVSNDVGSAESNAAKLTVNAVKASVTVNNGTGDGTYESGVTVTITADEPETGKVFSEWQVVSGGVDLADAKSSTTTFVMPKNAVEVTAVYSDIIAPVIITQHPSDAAVEEGGTASFTVAAGGTDPVYQWQVNDGTGWADIQGADQSTYTVTAVQTDWNGWQYRCVVSNSMGTAESNAAKLTVNASEPQTPETPEYRIAEGAGQSWTKGSTDGLVIRGDGDYAKFTGVTVDGVLLDIGNYEASSGSTVITLKAEYLNALSPGEHTVAILWTDGSAGTTITIAGEADADDDSAADDTENDDIVNDDGTGDDTANDDTDNDDGAEDDSDVENNGAGDNGNGSVNTVSNNNQNNNDSGTAAVPDKKDDVPKTGADTPVPGLLGLMLASGAGIAATGKKRKSNVR